VPRGISRVILRGFCFDAPAALWYSVDMSYEYDENQVWNFSGFAESLQLSDAPEYSFGGYDAGGIKKLSESDFEIFEDEQPFDIEVESGELWGWKKVAEVTVLARSGYAAIKMVSKLCPGYFYSFGEAHFSKKD
jgi:hypothetical protein